MSLVLSNKGKGMQSSSEQPLVGEEHCVTTLITAAKETKDKYTVHIFAAKLRLLCLLSIGFKNWGISEDIPQF